MEGSGELNEIPVLVEGSRGVGGRVTWCWWRNHVVLVEGSRGVGGGITGCWWRVHVVLVDGSRGAGGGITWCLGGLLARSRELFA